MTGHNLESYAELIDSVDNVPSNFDYKTMYALLLPLDPRPHGYLVPSTVSIIPWPAEAPIHIDHPTRTIHVLPPAPCSGSGSHPKAQDGETHLSPAAASPTKLASHVTCALQLIVDSILSANTLGITHGIHSEHHLISGYAPLGGAPSTTLERFTAPLFGILSRGAHMTCYVRNPLRIWVARRAANLHTYPSMLDTTVAGAVKVGDSPMDCIVAEADEEAGLGSEVLGNVVPAGTVSYVSARHEGATVQPTVLFVFDCEIGQHVKPSPKDGEVGAFYLWGVEEVSRRMLAEEFKPNCNLVMLDFFVRHGVIRPDEEGEYVELVTRLRRALPVPTRPLREREGV